MANNFLRAPSAVIEESEKQPSLTYKLDLDNGRIVGKTDGIEAMNQAIRKAIITPRFKALVYDSQYGSEIENAIIAKDATRYYINAAIERFVTDALAPDDRIIAAYDFETEFSEDGVWIEFKAETIFGETYIKEVIY